MSSNCLFFSPLKVTREEEEKTNMCGCIAASKFITSIYQKERIKHLESKLNSNEHHSGLRQIEKKNFYIIIIGYYFFAEYYFQ